MSIGIELITKERQRQIESEGWTPEHDAEHSDGSLALAACCYASPVQLFQFHEINRSKKFVDPWPLNWDYCFDKRRFSRSKGNKNYPYSADPSMYTPGIKKDLLVKAGALIAAEIDRLERAEGK